MSDTIIFIILGLVAATILGATSVFAHRAAKVGNTARLWASFVVWGSFTGLMYFAMQAANGWDFNPYALALLGISAPSGVGLGIGGLLGWMKGRFEDGHHST